MSLSLCGNDLSWCTDLGECGEVSDPLETTFGCQYFGEEGPDDLSCSSKDKAGEVHQVECAGAFNLQHGCRVPKPNLNVTNISTESTSSRRR